MVASNFIVVMFSTISKITTIAVLRYDYAQNLYRMDILSYVLPFTILSKTYNISVQTYIDFINLTNIQFKADATAKTETLFKVLLIITLYQETSVRKYTRGKHIK